MYVCHNNTIVKTSKVFQFHLDVAAAVPARTSNTTVVPTLGNAAVGASSTRSNSLPDNFAVVAETELVGAVAHNSAVLCAGA